MSPIYTYHLRIVELSLHVYLWTFILNQKHIYLTNVLIDKVVVE